VLDDTADRGRAADCRSRAADCLRSRMDSLYCLTLGICSPSEE
jgi:hypothetical protein